MLDVVSTTNCLASPEWCVQNHVPQWFPRHDLELSVRARVGIDLKVTM
jgi:hypothetical protein